MTNSPTKQIPTQFAKDSLFLKDLRIDHGRREQLGQFFLKADAAIRQLGLNLSYGTFDELIAVNKKNSDSWRPLLTIFDPQYGKVDDTNALCLFGRDAYGEVVAVHAARLYSWQETNFHQEASSLRLFYCDPIAMKRPDEKCIVNAKSTKAVTGQVVFSGAAWYRPDYRRIGLSKILPILGKACALTRWNPDYITSFMAEDIYRKGLAPRFGYPNVDWEIELVNNNVGTVRTAFVWMTGLNVEPQIDKFLSDFIIANHSAAIHRRA